MRLKHVYRLMEHQINQLQATVESLKPASNKEYASMTEVVMKKSELLERLLENKAKHDVVLAAAIQGYWDAAKEKVEQKRKQLLRIVEEYSHDVNRELDKINQKIDAQESLPNYITFRALNVDASLGLVYPEDHSKDYDRAIRMMQSSVFEEVKLSDNEYDQYVLNNWEWKDKFLASNSVYFSNSVSKYGGVENIPLSGVAGNLNLGAQGLVGDAGYARARAGATRKLSDGLKNF